MGEVWRGMDELLGRPVAVKLLSQKYAADEQFRARFRAEARYAASLSHPGIARVFDYGESDQEPPAAADRPAPPSATAEHTLPGPPGGGQRAGVAYLVMELIDGEPLSAMLARGGRRPVAETLDLIEQAASALQVAHAAGIVHRDVKPGNMLITPDGQVKITDFGIARAVLAAPVTQTGMVIGTARYVSPEQASGAPVTAASDIYSLGVAGYECLAGQPPFTAETPLALALAHVSRQPPALPADVPQPVAALIGQMLAKDPANRPASAQAVAERARSLRDSLPAADSRPAADRSMAGERGTAHAPLAPAPTLVDMPAAAGIATPAAWFRHGSRTDPALSLTGTARTNRTSGQRGWWRRSVLSALIVVAVLTLLTAGAIAVISASQNPAATAGPKHPTGRPTTHRTGRSRHPSHPYPAGPAPATATSRPTSARPTTPGPSRSPAGSPSPSPSPDPTGTPTGSPTPTSTPTPTGTGTSGSPLTQSPRQPGSTTAQDR